MGLIDVQRFTKENALISQALLQSMCMSVCAMLHQTELLGCMQVVELKPDWPKGYSRVGAAAHGAQDFDAAVAAYEKGARMIMIMPIDIDARSHGWCIIAGP